MFRRRGMDFTVRGIKEEETPLDRQWPPKLE